MAGAQQIEIPGVGLVEFPASMSDSDITAAAKRLHDDAKPPSDTPRSSASLTLAAAGKTVPSVASAAYNLGSHPLVSDAGRMAGEVAGLGKGALFGVPEAARQVGGSIGQKVASAAQRAIQPVAVALEKAAPYAQTLTTLGGAAGVGDLAQIAEPGRRDIGFLGLAASPDGPTPEAFRQVNARRADKGLPRITTRSEFELHAIKEAVSAGLTPAKAVAQMAQGDPKKFGALMTLYWRSK